MTLPWRPTSHQTIDRSLAVSLPSPTTRLLRPALAISLALALSATLVAGGQQGHGPLSELLDHPFALTAAASSPNSGNGNGKGVNGNNGNGNGNAPFTIAGESSDLTPGVTRPLPLTISNTQNFDIIVKTITVSVGSAGPGCPGSNAVATGFNGALTVPKKGTASLSLTIGMVANAANACQGKTFPLTYSGTGVKK